MTVESTDEQALFDNSFDQTPTMDQRTFCINPDGQTWVMDQISPAVSVLCPVSNKRITISNGRCQASKSDCEFAF